MIGTTRRVNREANTIDWTRSPSYGHKNPSRGGDPAPESIIYRVHPEKEAGRHIFQVGTSNPDLAVAAARVVAADVSGIDVNAGCPKSFSTHDGMGAALLRTPDKLVAILEALVREIVPEFNIGISVKIRILETPPETETLVRRLVATGITSLTVHCRTTPMRPRERAIREQLSMIAGICREAGVACMMNGDVESRDHAATLVPEFGVDGAMIAVAAEKNFSVFRAQSEGGPAPWAEVAERYFEYSLDVANKFSNTKFLLCHIVPGKAQGAHPIQSCKSYSDLCRNLGLDHLMERARETDMARGLDPDGGKSKQKQNVPSSKKGKAERKANRSALAAGGHMTESRNQDKKSLSQRGVGAKQGDDGAGPAAEHTTAAAVSA